MPPSNSIAFRIKSLKLYKDPVSDDSSDEENSLINLECNFKVYLNEEKIDKIEWPSQESQKPITIKEDCVNKLRIEIHILKSNKYVQYQYSMLLENFIEQINKNKNQATVLEINDFIKDNQFQLIKDVS